MAREALLRGLRREVPFLNRVWGYRAIFPIPIFRQHRVLGMKAEAVQGLLPVVQGQGLLPAVQGVVVVV